MASPSSDLRDRIWGFPRSMLGKEGKDRNIDTSNKGTVSVDTAIDVGARLLLAASSTQTHDSASLSG